MHELSDFDQRLRLEIYRRFIAQGAAPRVAELVEWVGDGAVREALARMVEQHVLVLHETGEIWMAMPFSGIETGYRVHGEQGSWWANCAWDALGIPALLAADVDIEARCPVSDSMIELTVRDGRVAPQAGQLIHFALPAANWWDDIGFT